MSLFKKTPPKVTKPKLKLTPEEFEKLVEAALSDCMIKLDEAEKVIEDYRREWFEQNPEKYD